MRTSITNGKKKTGIKPWSVLFWLAVWQLASMMIGQEILLASPVSAVAKLLVLCREPDFWRTIGFSLGRIGLGFFLALIIGVGLAVLSSMVMLIRDLLQPLLAAVKAIPVASFIILCLVWISSRNLSVFISFLMVLPIIYTNTLEGILNMDKGLAELCKVFQISRGKRVIYIYTSQVLPYLRSACSISLGICWKAGIAAEVIGTPKGAIGEKLYYTKIYLDMPALFAWTLVIVIISILFEKIIIGGIEYFIYRMEHQ
ncbi:MAG: ABC transporter permease [Lachnospiraceae bacterium]